MTGMDKVSVKTPAGIFILEKSTRGIFRVLFPSRSPKVRHGFKIEPLLRKARLRLDLTGYTPFQLKVYAALRKVQAGKTVTYRDLAKRAGYSGAARAVGSAMKKNRLPVLIPCHRVLPAGGGLGEYSAGKKWKRWLLESEKSAAQRRTVNVQQRRP